MAQRDTRSTDATQARPAPTRPPDASPEGRIAAVFRSQFRTLSALFPADGETMVTRAQSAACVAARAPHLRAIANNNPEAIAEKVIAAHMLGLEIGDQASLVPYGQDVQLIIGPRGLIALAFRSGFVKSIVARSVFAADVEAGLFDYDLGDNPFIRHKKADFGRREGDITHTYVVIETTTEGKIREVLTAEDMAFYRSFSKAKSGPWYDNYEGMCRKTAIKRGLEFVPRSPLLSAALRETSEGNYEIPEEIMAAVRAKTAGEAGPPQPEVIYEPAAGGAPLSADNDGR